VNAEKGGYRHFFLKEIHEQPQAVADTIGGRIQFAPARVTLETGLEADQIRRFERVLILAMGTSMYAGMYGKFAFEELARIPVEVDHSSEFRYRNPVVDERTLVITISQSGETADTLAALREAKRRGARTLGLVNVVGSTIAREVDGGIYLHAGPEIGVASTKAFTSQIVA